MKCFYINIDDDLNLGLLAVSLVDRPAIEETFLKFKDDKILFAKDEAKHIVSGPSLIADLPIYRRNMFTGEEYYVIFDAETILKLVERYSLNGLFNSVNLDHNENEFTDKVILIESYFVNNERGIAPKEYDLPDGSWMTSFKILDEDLWKRIVEDKEFKGFSVEVIANLVEKMKAEDEEKDELAELIKEILEIK